MKQERLVELDVLKGLSMLMVIIGHSRCFSPLYEFFNSFHVPLFFLVSGYFFSIKGNWGGAISRYSKQLILPYLAVSFIICIIYVLTGGEHADLKIREHLIGATIPNEYSIGLGPAWFFLALFFCRLFYRLIAQYINNINIRTIVVLIISSLPVIVNKYLTLYSIPYELSQGVVSLLYYHSGYMLAKNKTAMTESKFWKYRWSIIPVSLMVSVICLTIYKKSGQSMNLSSLDFPCFPLDFMNAVLLSLSLFFVVEYWVRKRGESKSLKLFSWIGTNSLIIYCIHCLEYNFTIHPLAELIDNTFASGNVVVYVLMRFVNPLAQIGICLLGLWLYQESKILYKKQRN